MFLRFAEKKHKHGTEVYAEIAEKYRENRKPITRAIRHLSPVRNEADRER